MDTLDKGQVAIMLGDTEYVLKPSLSAYNRISSAGSYRKVLNDIREGDIGTIAVVIRHGLGWNDQQSKKLPNLMFETGVGALTAPLTTFVFQLFNGGKTPEEVLAVMEADSGTAEKGNGQMVDRA